MRKTFLLWLFVFMTIAFIATFSVSYRLQTNEAAENARTLILLKINDVEKQITTNNHNLERIRAESNSESMAKARAFAHMIEMNPAIIGKTNELEKIRRILGVDELHVSNKNGILIGSTVEGYLDYDYASSPQSAAFLPAITDKDFELAQDPQPKGINNEMFQYVGVARVDSPGIVQIGYKPEKLARAMDTADIKNLAPGFRIGKMGTIILADRDTKILSIEDTSYIGKSLAEYGFREDQFKQDSGNFIATLRDQESLFVYKYFNDFLIIGQLPSDEMYLSRNNATTVLVIFNVLLFAVIFILVAKLVQKVVINGIYRVNNSLFKITKGDLNVIVDVNTNEEFESLSNGINKTVAALKVAIKEAASRIDSELAFAKAIQLSALPSHFPAFPDKKEFDIFACMYTAKEVGGDFYDFFMIDEKRLGIVIADVSGKGIPAALFMMVSKTLIKNFALSGLPVSEILFNSNNSLCENNDANMFVTVFIGILDVKTGKLSYANAGHNPPVLIRNTGEISFLPVKTDFVLAGMEDMQYSELEIKLEKGDKMLLYTDGVTEAVNGENALYTEERLLKSLKDIDNMAPLPEVLSHIKKDVDLFADGAEQADDITMLAVSVRTAKNDL